MKTTPWILSMVLLCAACRSERQDSATITEEVPSVPSAELLAVFGQLEEKEPEAIHRARVDAKPGDPLVLKGRVMGSISPFVEGRAAFIIGDEEKLTACSDMPGDSCETPWDNCCDSKSDLRVGTASVQVLGENGRVLKEAIEGVNGLEKLSRLVVEGVVAEGSGADNLVINAKVIEVRK